MRPDSLFFLFSGITRIKGVGTQAAEALQRLLPAATTLSGNNIPIVRDLLFHLPAGIIDRRASWNLSEIPKEPVIATLVVHVDQHVPPVNKRYGKKPYKVLCSNETGELTLVFFNAREDYIKQSLPVGGKRVISGQIEAFDFTLQMTHPDIIAPVEKLAEVQRPDPVYPLTVGLTSRRIGKIVEGAMEKLSELPEWIDRDLLVTKKFPGWKAALMAAHHPQSLEDIQTESPARLRLAYDEILANQLHLGRKRLSHQHQAGEIIQGNGKLTGALRTTLPFTLTNGQENVLKEIEDDMASGGRMGRLLQGDVGSGKTIVALLAMLRAAEQNLQSALMVPTEIIASQHYKTIGNLTQPLGIKVALLTGSIKGKARQEILEGVAHGDIHILIGTHALFQEQVTFSNLALTVIDEQHRFGVEQRMALAAKGKAPHVLHMTATPIPRSLTMTLYGDMDISQLKEKPAQRLPIVTRAIALSRYKEIMERLQAALDSGEKAYWICPLIENLSDNPLLANDDLAAAQSRFTEFKARFGEKVGLVHGRMSAAERDEAMRNFASGKTRLLVATTVVEVGVDIEDATIMVIEKAERFGLSQLHQLRGRVGRGEKPSSCVLLYTDRMGEEAKSRLAILRETEDGFRIAETDLALRGGGDLLGTRQSGAPRFIFTDLAGHQALLEHARADVAKILALGPKLETGRGEILKLLLQLFSYE